LTFSHQAAALNHERSLIKPSIKPFRVFFAAYQTLSRLAKRDLFNARRIGSLATYAVKTFSCFEWAGKGDTTIKNQPHKMVVGAD
jgi:hypothetical protein